jgi:hypothetical protein
MLEFPIEESDYWPLTNYRRRREGRRLSLLLNVLLEATVYIRPFQNRSFWAEVPTDGGYDTRWVNENWKSVPEPPVIGGLSPTHVGPLPQLEPGAYYGTPGPHYLSLHVPSDLDGSIRNYQRLSEENRGKFDRATFWMQMASRQWSLSPSASFASLVSAAEALTERGERHPAFCETCAVTIQHEVPGATENF